MAPGDVQSQPSLSPLVPASADSSRPGLDLETGVTLEVVPAETETSTALASEVHDHAGQEEGPVCDHQHFSHRSPWLRAALLGAQDGLISVASLMIGVGAVKQDRSSMVTAGLAGLVAGALSMAIGEFVSVYGQRDIEEADIRLEKLEHEKGPAAVAHELDELTQIYVSRGLKYELARQVAQELSAIDPVRAHARDELGIDVDDMSNPLQAAIASGISFVAGAIVPLLSAAFISTYWVRVLVVLVVSTLMFIFFGGLGAWLGGAKMLRAAVRTTIGGIIAIGITYGILRAFGTDGSI